MAENMQFYIKETKPKGMAECPYCHTKRGVRVAVNHYGYVGTPVDECIAFCKNCGYELDDYPTVAEAVAAWNDR